MGLTHLVSASQWTRKPVDEVRSEAAANDTPPPPYLSDVIVSNTALKSRLADATSLFPNVNVPSVDVNGDLMTGESSPDSPNPALLTSSFLNATLDWNRNTATGNAQVLHSSGHALEISDLIRNRISELSDDMEVSEPSIALNQGPGNDLVEDSSDDRLIRPPKRPLAGEDQQFSRPPHRIKIIHTSTTEHLADQDVGQDLRSVPHEGAYVNNTYAIQGADDTKAQGLWCYRVLGEVPINSHQVQRRSYSFSHPSFRVDLRSELTIAVKKLQPTIHRDASERHKLQKWIRRVRTVPCKLQSETINVFNIKDKTTWLDGERTLKTWIYYKIIDDDSAVFEFCRRGNYDDLNKALSTGGATVYDVNSDGMTLFHVAAEFCQPEICKLLLEKGANICGRDWTRRQRTAFGCVCDPEKERTHVDAHRMLETFRVLLDHGHDIIVSHEVDSDIIRLCVSVEMLESQASIRAVATIFNNYLDSSSCEGLFPELDTHDSTQDLLSWWQGEIMPVLEHHTLDEDQLLDILSKNSLRTLQTYLLRDVKSVQEHDSIYAPSPFTNDLLHAVGDLNFRVPFQYRDECSNDISLLELSSQSIMSWTYLQSVLEHAEISWPALIEDELRLPHCPWSAPFLIDLSRINADTYFEDLRERCPKLMIWYSQQFDHESLDDVLEWQSIMAALKQGQSFKSVHETIICNLERFNRLLEQQAEMSDGDSDTSDSVDGNDSGNDDDDDEHIDDDICRPSTRWRFWI
ncbi:hypothetical protein E4T38_06146 [Aureobasidium subglaciale]|nr:hypothetical protein E4T38_06146 [Aureobasidium subglaciale]KAI5219879.1 hypothetical protein E4T40_06167 [Aureobasidium subglaciale]KAI5223694.1 hypothetical protein E4T41_06031 [Aureobasidium subglaciale]KAI5260511.1 hypothetical protein E4T46_05901 [Aureobasidium subglaciale]